MLLACTLPALGECLAPALDLPSGYRPNAHNEAVLRELSCEVDEHPHNSELRLQFAHELAITHRYNEALNQYQLVLQDNPDSAVAQLGVAKVTSWQSHFDVAEDLYDALLRQHPDFYDAEVGRAFNLLWMGRKDEARAALLACRGRDPEDTEVAAALVSLGVNLRSAAEARRVDDSGDLPTPPHERTTTRRHVASAEVQSPQSAVDTAPARNDPGITIQIPAMHLPSFSAFTSLGMPDGSPMMPLGTALFLIGGFLAIRSWRHAVPAQAATPEKVSILLPVNADFFRTAGQHQAAAPAAAEAPKAERIATARPVTPRTQRILLAEDEAPVAQFVRETLEASGAHVVVCGRGSDAVEHLRDQSFDVIIADAKLPGMPGNELYCWLAENQPGLEKRLMLALAQPIENDIQRFVEKTGVLCITRPFAVPDLMVMTRLLTERARKIH